MVHARRSVFGRARVVALSVILASISCIGDKSAYLGVPRNLAVDSFGALVFGDACLASKADLCSTETVQSESFTVDPPSVLEVVAVEAVPADLVRLEMYKGAYMVHGLAPGHANVCGNGTFSDGTKRSDCSTIEVRAIDHVATRFECDPPIGDVTPAPLVRPGAALRLDVDLVAADGTVLDGAVLHPVDDAQLMGGPTSYLWSSPSGGGALTLTSVFDSKFSQVLATYGPDRVTGVVAAVDDIPPTVLPPGVREPIYVAEDVGASRACIGLPVTARTEAPDVCLGPKGEMTWAEEGGSGTSFTPVNEGTCRLSVGVVGGSGYQTTIEVPFYMTNPADPPVGRRLELRWKAVRLHQTGGIVHRHDRLRGMPLTTQSGPATQVGAIVLRLVGVRRRPR